MSNHPTIKSFIKSHSDGLSRLSYLAIAFIWLNSYEDEIRLVPWYFPWYLHTRINIPLFCVIFVPASVLIFYAIIPHRYVWLLIIWVFTVGWGMDFYASFTFLLLNGAKSGGVLGITLVSLFYATVLICCIFILYLLGPGLRNLKNKTA